MVKTLRAIRATQFVIIFAMFVILANGFQIVKYSTNMIRPVITSFSVIVEAIEPTHLLISGTMVKKRNCDFVSVIGYGSIGGSSAPKSLINVEFLDSDRVVTRTDGAQSWGPWKVYHAPFTEVELIATHQCGDARKVTQLWSYRVPVKKGG